jgi:hypothetical protein
VDIENSSFLNLKFNFWSLFYSLYWLFILFVSYTIGSFFIGFNFSFFELDLFIYCVFKNVWLFLDITFIFPFYKFVLKMWSSSYFSWTMENCKLLFCEFFLDWINLGLNANISSSLLVLLFLLIVNIYKFIEDYELLLLLFILSNLCLYFCLKCKADRLF